MDNKIVSKLDIQPGQTVSIINAPSDYLGDLGELPEGVFLDDQPIGKFDFVQLFVKNLDDVNRMTPNAIGSLKPGSTFWISYPKQESQVQTDLTKDVGWDVIYDHKFEQTDEISINDMWSAKRFQRIG